MAAFPRQPKRIRDDTAPFVFFGQQPCTKNSMTRRGSAKGSLDSRKRRQGRRGEALSRRFYTYNVEHRARWRRQPENRRRSSISHAKIPRPTVIASTPSPPPPPMPQSLLQWLSSSERSAIVADNKSVIIASRRANTSVRTYVSCTFNSRLQCTLACPKRVYN